MRKEALEVRDGVCIVVQGKGKPCHFQSALGGGASVISHTATRTPSIVFIIAALAAHWLEGPSWFASLSVAVAERSPGQASPSTVYSLGQNEPIGGAYIESTGCNNHHSQTAAPAHLAAVAPKAVMAPSGLQTCLEYISRPLQRYFGGTQPPHVAALGDDTLLRPLPAVAAYRCHNFGPRSHGLARWRLRTEYLTGLLAHRPRQSFLRTAAPSASCTVY